MDNIGTVKRNYNIAILLLTGVLAGGTLACSLRPSEWAFFFLPVLGAVATALVWLAVARFFFCRDARRLLAPSFKTPLKLAVIMPLWCVFTTVLVSIPSDTSGWDEDLAGTIVLFVMMVLLVAVPLCTIILGALSIYKGYAHMKSTPAVETKAYREAPFAIALLLFIGMMGLLLFAVGYTLQ